MKLKRTISALAALAMSVSCLAGLTITANAADGPTTLAYIGTLDGSNVTAETFDDYAGAPTHATLGSLGSWSAKGDSEYTFNDATEMATSNHFGVSSSLVGVTQGTTIPAEGESYAAYNEDTAPNAGYPKFVSGKTLEISKSSNTWDVASATFTIAKPIVNGKVYFDADMNNFSTNGSIGGAFLSLNGADGTPIFQIGPWDGRAGYNFVYNKLSNGAVVPLDKNNHNDIVKQNLRNAGSVLSGAGYHIHFEVDLDDAKASYSITTMDNSSPQKLVVKTGSDIAVPSGVPVGQLVMTANISTTNKVQGLRLDNAKFYAKTEVADKAYTIKYVTDKTSADTIAATTVYTDSGNYAVLNKAPSTLIKNYITADKTTDGKKYFVDETEAALNAIVVDSDNKEIVVKVRKANYYDYKVVTGGEGNEITLTDPLRTATLVEGEAFTDTGYPQYLFDADKKIVYATDKQASGNYFMFPEINEPSENVTKTLTYKKKFENVVYFKDFEDGYTQGSNTRASGGKAAGTPDFTSDILPAGTYTIVARGQNSKRGSYLKVGTKADTDTVIWGPLTNDGGGINKDAWAEVTKADVTLDKGGIVYNVKGTNFDPLDTIIVYGTPDAPTVDTAEVVTGATLGINYSEDLNNLSGTTEAPTFKNIDQHAAYKDAANSKIVKITVINPEEGVVPVVSVGGKELKVNNWKGVASTTDATTTYYAKFMKKSTLDWSNYGTVTVTYGDSTKTIDLVGTAN